MNASQAGLCGLVRAEAEQTEERTEVEEEDWDLRLDTAGKFHLTSTFFRTCFYLHAAVATVSSRITGSFHHLS